MTDVVLDTNVWVSSYFWNGPSERVVDRLVDGGHRIFTSPELLDEFAHVLKRDFQFDDVGIEQAIGEVMSVCNLVTPSIVLDVVKSDPSDNRVLECALGANVQFVVSQDKKHLLKIQEFEGVKIFSPIEFLQWLDGFQK